MWHPLRTTNLGLLSNIESLFLSAQGSDPSQFPDLGRATTVLVGSDYGGEHQGALYRSYTFLLTDLETWQDWEPSRRNIRTQHGLGSRRMEYKKLRDRVRQRILPQFLREVGTLSGGTITFLVDRSIDSLFTKDGAIDPGSPPYDAFAHWKQGSFEKFLRITHLLGFLVAGLSRPRQNILWFTDEDEVAANPARLGELTKAFGHVASVLVQHDLGHLRCGTTASDHGDQSIEDLVGIADLVAGTVNEVLDAYRREGVIPTSELVVPLPDGLPAKVLELVNWISDSRNRLRPLVVALDQQEDGLISVKRFTFHGGH